MAEATEVCEACQCNPVEYGQGICKTCQTELDDAQATLVASSSVHHPSHYNQSPSGVECLTVVRHMNYNLGTAMAYIWRSPHKGEQIQDLQKAICHLQDEITRLQTD